MLLAVAFIVLGYVLIFNRVESEKCLNTNVRDNTTVDLQ